MPASVDVLSPSAGDFRSIFNALPGATLLLSPDWVILGASNDYLAATLTERAALVGQHIFGAFPDNPDTPEANGTANVRASLETVLATRAPHEMAPQHYDVPDRTQPGRFVERHWKPLHTPVLDPAGQVQYIIQSVQDITESRVAEQRLRASQAAEQAARADAEEQRAALGRAFEQAPVSIAILRGPEFIVELANPSLGTLWGRPVGPALGRPLFEALPDLAGQGLEELLTQALRTGEPVVFLERPARLVHDPARPPALGYYNFTYQPLHDGQGLVTGLITVGLDVTEQVRARQQVEQLNQQLEARVDERTREALALQADLLAAAQQRAQQQEQFYQIFSQTPAAICLLRGPEHRYEYFNAAYQRQFASRELPGRTVAEALPETVEQGFIALLDNVYQTGETYFGQELLLTIEAPADAPADAPARSDFYNLTYQAYREDGQIVGVCVFAYVVTEQVVARRQNETLQDDLLVAAQQQADQQALLYQIFEQTPAVVALLRAPAHRFEYANPAYSALFPGRELLGRDATDAVPELAEQGFVALLDLVFQTGETYFGHEVPFTAQPASGEAAARTGYYNFTYQAYRERGEVAGVSIFASDVTEQVLSRQQREAERQQLHGLFMEAPAPIVILDGPELVYQLVNPAYQRIFPGRTLLGKPLLVALPELAEESLLLGQLQRVYDTGETFVAQELPLQLARHDNGPLEEIYWTFTYQARRNAQGDIDGVLVFAHEVTDQVQARRVVEEGGQQALALAAQLAASNQQLTRTNVDLDNFIYTASHDLKVPIANIEGLLEALARQLPPAARVGDVPEMLQLMQLATERFRRTIEHLTDVSKLQQAHSQPATQVPLADVVEEVRLDLLPLVQQTQAQLSIDVPADAHVPFSEKNLRSMVYNLLSNALKYHHPNRPPCVALTYQRQDNYHLLCVQDNGLGFDVATSESKLFGMFQRLHTHVEGSGIGLYMVKKMVENSGGRINVTSRVGKGTTFTVFIPIQPVS